MKRLNNFYFGPIFTICSSEHLLYKMFARLSSSILTYKTTFECTLRSHTYAPPYHTPQGGRLIAVWGKEGVLRGGGGGGWSCTTLTNLTHPGDIREEGLRNSSYTESPMTITTLGERQASPPPSTHLSPTGQWSRSGAAISGGGGCLGGKKRQFIYHPDATLMKW